MGAMGVNCKLGRAELGRLQWCTAMGLGVWLFSCMHDDGESEVGAGKGGIR